MGISSLTNDISVCYMNDHSVFGCVVLIFVLDYQSFLSIVVSFALLLSSEFYLVSLEVGHVLDNLTDPILWNRSPTLQLATELYGPILTRLIPVKFISCLQASGPKLFSASLSLFFPDWNVLSISLNSSHLFYKTPHWFFPFLTSGGSSSLYCIIQHSQIHYAFLGSALDAGWQWLTYLAGWRVWILWRHTDSEETAKNDAVSWNPEKQTKVDLSWSGWETLEQVEGHAVWINIDWFSYSSRENPKEGLWFSSPGIKCFIPN